MKKKKKKGNEPKKKDDSKNTRGRPSIFDDKEKEQQLTEIMRFKPTLKDTAAFFRVHTDTIEKHIKKNHNMKFSEFREMYMVECRFNVVRALIKTAEAGNVKAIELALAYLFKWTSKDKEETKRNIYIKYNIVGPEEK